MREGWELKSLGDICDISTGKSNTEDAIENGEYAFFDRSKIIKKSSKYLFDCDAIIVAGEGQTFFPKFFSGKFDLHQRAYALYNFQESVSVKYAFKYLIHFHKYFESVAVGATAKSLRLRHFQELPIPLPPLPEQQRIVAILDECFAALEKAKANAQQNLKNAKELFESYLQGVFEKKGEGWEEKKILDLCDGKENIVGGPFGSNLKVEHYKSSGVPILRLQNIGKGYFIDKDIKYVSKEKAKELEYHSFQSGDLALAKLGIPIGKTCIIPNDFEFGIVVADVVRIRPNNKKVDYNFLNYFLNTNLSVSQLTGNISGATRPRVNLDDVRNIIVSIPPLQEQQTIVRQLDSLRAETQKLEAVYQKKLADLEELKKSILQKAFAGELTYKSMAS
jgi:type I restriction enzyme S subunit